MDKYGKAPIENLEWMLWGSTRNIQALELSGRAAGPHPLVKRDPHYTDYPPIYKDLDLSPSMIDKARDMIQTIRGVSMREAHDMSLVLFDE